MNDLHSAFLAKIQRCKTRRRELIADWAENIDRRRGTCGESSDQTRRVRVPIDYTGTKAKVAQLFSQIPAVHLDPPLPGFERKLNATLTDAKVGAALEMNLPDVVNAAGIAACLCAYEARTSETSVPAIDLRMMPQPLVAQILSTKTLPDGSPLPFVKTTRVTDHRYTINRISPADLLWPVDFAGSDFDEAPWIGRSGRMPWAEAQIAFNLTEDDKEHVIGDGRTSADSLNEETRRDDHEEVSFDELFYKTYRFDPTATSFHVIRRLVFVTGKSEPVIDEPWAGQKWNDDGAYLGACTYPIRVLTLDYFSDEAIPPSTSSISKPLVDELNESRSQMVEQRAHSQPIRWYNSDRVDETTQQALAAGTWQGMIPVQGDGERIIGEIARAQYPREDFSFDQVARNDLNDTWQLLTPAASATASRGDQALMGTRNAQERAKVSAFFCGIAEVIGGLMALYEPQGAFGDEFDRSLVSKSLTFSITADSTLLLDSNQKLDRCVQFLNYTAKSGWVDLQPVLTEMAVLSGFDPSIVRPPQPRAPEPPNVSIRFTGVQDLLNPLVIAMLGKAGQLPSPEELQAAKALLESASTPLPAPNQDLSGSVQQVPMPPAPPRLALPPAQTPEPFTAHPQWEMLPRINTRTSE
jgi:hypothetical protein